MFYKEYLNKMGMGEVTLLKLALVGFFAWLMVRGRELQKEEEADKK